MGRMLFVSKILVTIGIIVGGLYADVVETETETEIEVVAEVETVAEIVEVELAAEIEITEETEAIVEIVETETIIDQNWGDETIEAIETEIADEAQTQFVVLRISGNCDVEALAWLLNVARRRKNPDSSQIEMTFFVNALNLSDNAARKALRRAHRSGHEIANGTFSGFLDTLGEIIDARYLNETIWRAVKIFRFLFP